MELKEFQGLALRTESRIDGIKLNRDNLVKLLKVTVAVSEILDGIKKAAFYNKTAKLEGNFGPLLADIEHLVHDLYLDSEFDGTVNAVLDQNESISNVDPRVFHGILGIITESGELAAALLKSVENPSHVVDAVNIQEEMSDIAWYKAILHDTLSLDWGQGLRNVIEKLRIRYPDKYSDYNADNRNLEAERAALEVGVAIGPAWGIELAQDAENSGLDVEAEIEAILAEEMKVEQMGYANAKEPISFAVQFDYSRLLPSSKLENSTTVEEVENMATLLGITLENTCACGKNPACECKEN